MFSVKSFSDKNYITLYISRVLEQESEGALDVSSLPSDLQALAGPFDSEDPYVDNLLKDFDESKVCT